MALIFVIAPLYEWVEAPFLFAELEERVPWTQPVYDLFEPLMKYLAGMRYDNLWRQLAYCTFNNALPVATAFALLLAACPKPAATLHYSALIVSSSPLSALALMPYLGLRLLPQLKRGRDWLRMFTSSGAVPAGILLLFCVAIYFSSTHDASQTRFLWQDSSLYKGLETDGAYRMGRYAIMLFLTAVPAIFFLYRRFHRLAAFRSSLFLMVFLPLIWVGYENNELLFKGSMPLFLCLSILYMLSFCHCRKRWVRTVFLLFFAASSMHFVVDVTLRFGHYYSWDPAMRERNIRNDWEGHLNHPGHMYYSRFIGKPSCPVILKTQDDL